MGGRVKYQSDFDFCFLLTKFCTERWRSRLSEDKEDGVICQNQERRWGLVRSDLRDIFIVTVIFINIKKDESQGKKMSHYTMMTVK